MLDDGIGPGLALPGLRGLLRTVRVPEFAGTTFHEVEAKSVLNRVPGTSPVPFRWTVNPYRGCGHACVYCLEGATPVLLADGRTRPAAGASGPAPTPRRSRGSVTGSASDPCRAAPTGAAWPGREPAGPCGDIGPSCAPARRVPGATLPPAARRAPAPTP